MVVSFLCPSSRQGQHQISTAFNAKAAKNWRFSHSLCPAVPGELHASHSGARCQFLPCCGSWEEILVLFVPHQLLGAHPAPLCHPCSAKGVSSSQVWYRSVITGISSSKDIFHLLKTSIETRYIIYTWIRSFIMQMYRTSNTSWLPLHRAEHPNLVLEVTFFFTHKGKNFWSIRILLTTSTHHCPMRTLLLSSALWPFLFPSCPGWSRDAVPFPWRKCSF